MKKIWIDNSSLLNALTILFVLFFSSVVADFPSSRQRLNSRTPRFVNSVQDVSILLKSVVTRPLHILNAGTELLPRFMRAEWNETKIRSETEELGNITSASRIEVRVKGESRSESVVLLRDNAVYRFGDVLVQRGPR